MAKTAKRSGRTVTVVAIGKLKPSKKRSPQDATLRNIAASRRREAEIDRQLKGLQRHMQRLAARTNRLCESVDRLFTMLPSAAPRRR